MASLTLQSKHLRKKLLLCIDYNQEIVNREAPVYNEVHLRPPYLNKQRYFSSEFRFPFSINLIYLKCRYLVFRILSYFMFANGFPAETIRFEREQNVQISIWPLLQL